MSNHWHCTACHHEWDGREVACGWCGAAGEVIGPTNWPTEEQFRRVIEMALAKHGHPKDAV